MKQVLGDRKVWVYCLFTNMRIEIPLEFKKQAKKKTRPVLSTLCSGIYMMGQVTFPTFSAKVSTFFK